MAVVWLIGTWPENELAPLRGALEAARYKVKPEPGGSVEVADVIVEDPDFVIMLQRLPEQDQTGSLMLIREFSPDVPVSFLTNTATKDNILMAKKYGVNDYWVAPIKVDAILPRVQKLVPAPAAGEEEKEFKLPENSSPYVEVPLSEILEGMVLAQPVEVRGAVMLHQGTPINQGHVDKLSRWGVPHVTIMRRDYEKLKSSKSTKTIQITQAKEDIWEREVYRVGMELLPVGQMLDLSLDSGGHKFFGNLDDTGPGGLVIGLPGTEKIAGRLHSGEKLHVHYQSRGAGYRFTTEVERVTKGGDLVLKHPSVMFKKQLRGAVREEFNMAFVVWKAAKDGAEKEEFDAYMGDISAGGIGFKSKIHLEKGDEVFLKFKLEDGLEFEHQPSAVVRVQELRHDTKFKFNYGVVFSNMPEFTKEKIMRFIFKIQREKQQVGTKRR